MASSSLPSHILLEDANDLAEIAETSGRWIPREKWVQEIIDAINNNCNQGIF